MYYFFYLFGTYFDIVLVIVCNLRSYKMKYIIGLILIAFTIKCYAAEPLLELKNFPSKNEIEVLEDNDGLFASKVLEYYKFAALYEAQLNSMGIKPEKVLDTPTLDEIQDAEATTLKKYYSVAKALYEQLKKSPGSNYNAKYEELKKKYKVAENQIFTLKDALYWESLENSKIEYYKTNFPKLVKEIEDLRFKNDSLYLEYNTKLWQSEEKLRNIYNHKTYKKPLISGGITVNQFYINNDFIESDISPAIHINISPESVFGFGKFFDIWAEFQMPVWKSSYTTLKVPNQLYVTSEYKTNIYNTGLALNLPLSELFHFKGFMFNLRLGGGLFWGNARMMSSNLQKTDWDGYMFKGDINLVNYSHYFPVGITAGVNFFNFNKSLNFNQSGGYFDLGKISLSNLYLGIEVPIVSSTFLLK